MEVRGGRLIWGAKLGAMPGGRPEQGPRGAVGPGATLPIFGFKAMQIFDTQDSLPLPTSS